MSEQTDDWWDAPAISHAAVPGSPDAWLGAVTALGDMVEGMRDLGRHLPAGCAYQVERNTAGHVVALVAALQDLRRDIAQAEAYLARECGRDPMLERKGVLPDGREYEVSKSKSRKAWDHDAWQGTVREQVTSGLLDTVYGDDGQEAGSLSEVIAAVQAVHGAGAPRVTALRALGISPDEFCETVPGPWAVRVAGHVPLDGV